MNDSDPVVLRSLSNPTVRHLVRMRDNRARRRAGRVIVDGWRETQQAIHAGLRICGLYLPEELAHDCAWPSDASGDDITLEEILQQKLTWVSSAVMEKISYGQSSRGVVAEFESPRQSLDNLNLGETPTLLILDQIEKPGNIGAVFRCADAAGVDAILLCGNSDIYNPNAIRSSLGAVFRVPSANADEAAIEAFLVDHGIRALAARVESSQSLWEVDLDPPLAVVLGSEAQGLGQRWQTIGGSEIPGVQIPMSGKVDSLNLAVSAAIIAFEAARRRS